MIVSPNRTGGVVAIQYNWEENFREKKNVWVYYKQLHEKSKHGDVGDSTFNVVSQKNRNILVNYVANNLQTLFVCPARKFSDIHSKSIISLDVGEGGLGVSVSSDNQLHVWETQDGVVRRRLEGHAFDVYSVRLFPSGVVVLSAGADMQIRVWDAATGLCPSVLKGHTASVTDTAIVDRGRNVVSVSKDGSARLWNCAESRYLSTVLQVETRINCCAVVDAEGGVDIPQDNEMAEELEYGTGGKLLCVGCEDGRLVATGLRGGQLLGAHSLGAPVLAVCWLASFRLAIGCEDGRLMLWDATTPTRAPQLLSHDSASGILCLKPLDMGLLLGRRDGLCQFYLLDGTCPVQLTGPDCDPVYAISTDSNFVYTACRDAVVRKYSLRDMGLLD